MPSLSRWPALTDDMGAIGSQERGESRTVGLRRGVIASTQEKGGSGRWVGQCRKARFAKERSSHPLQVSFAGNERLQTLVSEGSKDLLGSHFCGWLRGPSRSSCPPTCFVLGPAHLFLRMLCLLNLVNQGNHLLCHISSVPPSILNLSLPTHCPDHCQLLMLWVNLG